jgi:hypothetical protein
MFLIVSFAAPIPCPHNFDLFFRQRVQLIHQPVDLSIGGLDVALQHLFLLRCAGGGAGKFLLAEQLFVPMQVAFSAILQIGAGALITILRIGAVGWDNHTVNFLYLQPVWAASSSQCQAGGKLYAG